MMDAKKRERIDSQVMTALNRGETSRKRISQTTGIDALAISDRGMACVYKIVWLGC